MIALICGVSGQDGAYLARLLLEKGYTVIGTSRDATTSEFRALGRLGIMDDVEKVSMAGNDFRSVLQTLRRFRPDEIYNLAGQTSVGLSFEQPVETMESISGATLNLLEAIRFVDHSVRLYNAGSSECFGEAGDAPADEFTPFRPMSPYAVAKCSAHWLVDNYRQAYGLHACTGILFNHESPLRPARFVTQKIVRAAADIGGGSGATLYLGDIGVRRDWGYAPDYVEAMWRMLRHDAPDDFVIATGRTEPLEYFVARAFAHFDLDWRAHVRTDDSFKRPTDIRTGKGNPSKAERVLGWRATHDIDDVVRLMCEAAMARA